MKSFKVWLMEKSGGSKAGLLEISKTSVARAIEHAISVLGQEKYDEIVNFPNNYKLAQQKAAKGWTKRKDMPVISSRDVHQFQNHLQHGYLDITKPFSSKTNSSKPFPEGLSGNKAKEWLENGLVANDGSASDDRVKVISRRVPVGSLNPIQSQIYLDKSLIGLSKGTISSTKNFLSSNTIYITSSDNYIIDGHHRYLSGMIIDPNMKVQTMAINLPIKILLPLAVAYGDAVGNKRNK